MSMAGFQERVSAAAGQAAAKEGMNIAGEQLQLRWPACKYLSLIRTIVGCVLVLSVWSTAFDGLFSLFCVPVGIYLLLLAVPITMLEFSFLINKLACCGNEGFCCSLWHVSLKFDGWKRGAVYIILSLLLFIPPFLCFWGVVTELVKPEQIVVCDRNASKRKAFQEQGIEICDSVSEVYKKHGSGIVFLTVKPHCLQEALAPFVKAPNGVPKVGLLISVLAGVTIKAIQNLIEPQKLSIVRVMPNTPALVGCGASVFSMADGGTLAHALLLQSLLETVGICYQVKESQINAVNGVSGSGPAYVYTFLDAMSDAGVKAGLPRQLATHLAAQTIYGAAKMQLETGKHPGELKNAVCSPGGTTIAGILALEEGGFRATVMHAVQASVNRADEIGKLHE